MDGPGCRHTRCNNGREGDARRPQLQATSESDRGSHIARLGQSSHPQAGPVRRSQTDDHTAGLRPRLHAGVPQVLSVFGVQTVRTVRINRSGIHERWNSNSGVR